MPQLSHFVEVALLHHIFRFTSIVGPGGPNYGLEPKGCKWPVPTTMTSSLYERFRYAYTTAAMSSHFPRLPTSTDVGSILGRRCRLQLKKGCWLW